VRVCVRARVRAREPWTGLSVRTVSGRDLRASPRGSRKKPKLGHLKDDGQTFFCDSLEGVLRNLKKIEFGISHARWKEGCVKGIAWWSN
jgi:hypothetical protein